MQAAANSVIKVTIANFTRTKEESQALVFLLANMLEMHNDVVNERASMRIIDAGAQCACDCVTDHRRRARIRDDTR